MKTKIIRLADHARASTGYKSGLSSCLETPVTLSTGNTNSPGSPFLDRSSQYQTWDCVVPIKSASGFCPPAASQALRRASLVMGPHYPNFGELQPKNLCRTANRFFGSHPAMKPVDSEAFGRRLKQRREELGISQEHLGDSTGYSQSNIGWLESGGAKRPQRAASDLAVHLLTTREWLLWEDGPKHVGPSFMPTQVLAQKYDALSPARKAEISEAIENTQQNKKRKKAG